MPLQKKKTQLKSGGFKQANVSSNRSISWKSDLSHWVKINMSAGRIDTPLWRLGVGGGEGGGLFPHRF